MKINDAIAQTYITERVENGAVIRSEEVAIGRVFAVDAYGHGYIKHKGKPFRVGGPGCRRIGFYSRIPFILFRVMWKERW